MRGYVPDYELKNLEGLNEALALLQNEPDVWKPFAGGTDLMVLLEAGALKHKKFFSLWGLPELKGIYFDSSTVTLGAMTTYSQIQENNILSDEFPLLGRAAKETGAVAIQNRGTLGGNIVNASPAADSPPALLVYDAEVELTSLKGSRWVPYSKFHLGYKKIAIESDELLTKIRLPRRTGERHHYYRKVGTRKAQAISKICLAGVMELKNSKIDDIRIALGSVAPTPVRCHSVEKFLTGKAITIDVVDKAKLELLKEIAPIDDIRSTSEYRLRVSANLLEEFLCGIGSLN